ncbi:glycosyltransferase family 4 protein [Gilvimarinus sp. F26214L]|uniref:glycosyltransferase family 4 protein n=1 Tax=Gilvimarinus sp. DZF01 TaxID=3461371 RepID=UPI0040462799
MTSTVLQLNKIYRFDAPLINNMVKPDSKDFRTVTCYLSGKPDGRNGMEQRAAQTVYCRIPLKQVNWRNRETIRRVAAIIDEYEVDLVVCQYRRSIPIGVLAAMLSKRKPKVIAILHGIVGGKVGWGRKLVNFFAFRKLAKVVSVSEAGVADILKLNIALDPGKVTAIPNGLDCEPFLAPSRVDRENLFPKFGPQDFIFVMVGRLAPVKNHQGVLRAFAALAGDFPQARLAIVGTGPMEAEIRRSIAALDLKDRVQLLGYRTDVPDILKNADAYLMPSFREGFGLALAEAMVCRLPVITSRTGGMRELVPGERYGLLVDPNSVESIAVAMRRVMQNHPEKNRTIGDNARRRVLENFTAERMADDYEALYRSVLAPPGENHP